MNNILYICPVKYSTIWGSFVVLILGSSLLNRQIIVF